MFFEDNDKQLDKLDDLDLSLDGGPDDKSITWEELLEDNADLDLVSIKKSSSDAKDASGDIVLDAEGDISLRSTAPQRDAFEVFGGSSTPDVDVELLEDDSFSAGSSNARVGKNFSVDENAASSPKGTRHVETPNVPRNSSSGAAMDEYNFAMQGENKKSGSGVLMGVIAAVFVTVLGVCGYFIFLNPGILESAKNGDFTALLKQNQATDAPVVDAMKNDLAQQEALKLASEADQAKQLEDANVSPNEQGKKIEDKKAEAKKSEDKKAVLTVVSGGRSNPFVPIGNINLAGFATIPDIDIASPPSDYGNAEDVQKLMSITVSGILYDKVKPSAIINVSGSDYFVQRGDKVDNYIVTAITPTNVTISSGKNTYRAGVGQYFDDGKISGQTTYANNKFGASRQYTTANDIQVNVKEQSPSSGVGGIASPVNY